LSKNPKVAARVHELAQPEGRPSIGGLHKVPILKNPKHELFAQGLVAELAKIAFSDIRRALDWGMTPPDEDGKARNGA
jgi:hypothetical protein